MLNKIKSLIFNYEFLIPLFMLAFIVVYFFDISSLPAPARGMPTLIGSVALVLIAILLFTKHKDIFNFSRIEDGAKDKNLEDKQAATRKVAIITAIVILYIVGIYLIGYFVSTFIMIVATALLLGERNYLSISITTILFSVIMYFVFVSYFSLRLPSNLLF